MVRLYTKANMERLMRDERYYILRMTLGPKDDAVEVSDIEKCSACGHTFAEHHQDDCNEGGYCLTCPPRLDGVPECFAFAFRRRAPLS